MSYEINQLLISGIPTICMLTLPISIITQSGFKKSCLSAVSIYFGFLFLNYISN